MKKKNVYVSRRRFLETSGAIAAAASLPAWMTAGCATTEAQQARVLSPNDKIQVALVGCGSRGTWDARHADSLGAKVVALCDVDENHIPQAKEHFPDAPEYSDFREVMARDDVDAVICGTVDHWHTLVSLAAMRSGKDIYCEKPLTLTIDEGKHLVETERETKQILQTGTQQRSSIYFRMAANLVRNKRIGDIQHVDVWIPAGLRNGPFPTSAVPEGFDYDFWLGPTPNVLYVKERTHFSFRYWWEYSGGTMTDWGAHHNDIVLWALDMDGSGPVSIEGKQLVDMIPGGFTAASEYDVKFTYDNGVVHRCRSTTDCEWHGGLKSPDGQNHGIKFTGTDGWIWVTRGEITASDRSILSDELPADAERVYESKDHMQNFLDCMRTREAPICPAEVGHRSSSVAHLGVASIRLGRKLQWDPAKEVYIGDDEAQSLASRPMREPYGYDMT
jgi:predicted dehydrogenase